MRNDPFTPANLDLIKSLRERGIANKQIAEVVGISDATVSRAVKMLDLPRRSQGRKAAPRVAGKFAPVATPARQIEAKPNPKMVKLAAAIRAERSPNRVIEITASPEATRMTDAIRAERRAVPFDPAAVRRAIAYGPEPRPVGNGIVAHSPKAWLTLSEDERKARATARRTAEEKARRDEAKATARDAITRAIDAAKSARSAAIAEIEAEACSARKYFRRLAGPLVHVNEPHVFDRLTPEAREALAYVQTVEEAAWHLRKGQFVSAVAVMDDKATA